MRFCESQRGQNVDGILALGDRPAVAAAYAARGLGIPYNHPASVEACRSKLRMREVFREAGLSRSVVSSCAAASRSGAVLAWHFVSVRSQAAFAFRKPGRGSREHRARNFSPPPRGLAVCSNRRKFARPANPISIEILVEGYVPGREVAVEGLLTEGQLRVLAIFDKPDPLEGPYFEESIYVTPSRFAEAQQREIERCAADTVRALGLSHGPIHAEFRLNDEGVWPLEVAPRPIGGLCARALRFARDASSEPTGLEELLLRHSLDLPGSDWPREKNASGVMMIPVPKSGVLEKVEGEEAARSVQGITALEITARLHDYIAAWPEGSSYLGFLFARAGTPEEVENALRAAHAKLHFDLAARLPVEHPVTGRLPAAEN